MFFSENQSVDHKKTPSVLDRVFRFIVYSVMPSLKIEISLQSFTSLQVPNTSAERMCAKKPRGLYDRAVITS